MAEKLQADSSKEGFFPRPTPFALGDAHVPWTLQSFAFEPEVKRWSDRLDYKRQGGSSDCQYPDSVTGNTQYCRDDGVCCSSPTKNACCDFGYYCVNTERCCLNGYTACSSTLCCSATSTCCGNTVCCESGTVCDGTTCINPAVSSHSAQSVASILSIRTESTASVASVSSASRASISIASVAASHSATSHKAAVVGGAVGGVVGGIALIAAIVFLWIFLKRKNSANAGATGEQMSPNNQPMLFQGGGNIPYTPNSFKQPLGSPSYLGAGTYSGAAEVMSDRPTSFGSSVITPLPMTMERARTTAGGHAHAASISSLPYAIPPGVATHPGASPHLGSTSS